MNKINYQKELEKIEKHSQEEGVRYKLLLHSCCAPCSSYCLVSLRQYFDITCLYYNPNITDADEYKLRISELHRLADSLNEDAIGVEYASDGKASLRVYDDKYLASCGTIEVIDGRYEADSFLERVRENNLALCPEGGDRCSMCFDMRLSETARVAMEGDFDYFTTSLTISPLKDAQLLNQIGMNLALSLDSDVKWLPSDFKKKNGYLMSVELCKRYDLYRQDYCGCIFSKNKH